MAAAETNGAGVLIWRRNDEGEVELALVHRVKQDDWGFPKGNRSSNEHLISCAYREGAEETGFEFSLGYFLGEISYATDAGINRRSYWSAKFMGLTGSPDAEEIDSIRWVNRQAAHVLLSEESERSMIDDLFKRDLDASILILLRHAKAVARDDWKGDDLDRPLDAQGALQARRLISILAPFNIKEIHSSSAVRCYETVEPLARALESNYFYSDVLSDYSFEKNEDRTLKRLNELLDNDVTTLVCSHNPILPRFVSKKFSKQGFDVGVAHLNPSDAWVLHHIDGEVLAIDYVRSTIT